MPAVNLGASGKDLWDQISFADLVTSAAAPAGTTIAVAIWYWRNSPDRVVTTVNDGAAYTLAGRWPATGSGQNVFEIWYRYAPAGLASGSTITATNVGPGAIGSMVITAAALADVSATDPVVATASNNNQSDTGWTTGAATNTGVANAVFYGGAGHATAATATSTPTSGTEVHDYRNASLTSGIVTGIIDATTVASRSLSGTLTSSSTVTVGGLVVFRGAAAGTTHERSGAVIVGP